MFMPAVFHENLFDDLFDPFWNEGALERAMNREERETFGKRGANMMKTDVKQTDNGYPWRSPRLRRRRWKSPSAAPRSVDGSGNR